MPEAVQVCVNALVVEYGILEQATLHFSVGSGRDQNSISQITLT